MLCFIATCFKIYIFISPFSPLSYQLYHCFSAQVHILTRVLWCHYRLSFGQVQSKPRLQRQSVHTHLRLTQIHVSFLLHRPIIKFVILGGCGALMAWHGMLSPAGSKVISGLILNYTLPALLFAKMVSCVSLDNVQELG